MFFPESSPTPSQTGSIASPSPFLRAFQAGGGQPVVRFPEDAKNMGIDLHIHKELTNLEIKKNNVLIADEMKKHSVLYKKVVTRVKTQERAWEALNRQLQALPKVKAHLDDMERKLHANGKMLEQLERVYAVLRSQHHENALRREDTEANEDLLKYRAAMQERLRTLGAPLEQPNPSFANGRNLRALDEHREVEPPPRPRPPAGRPPPPQQAPKSFRERIMQKISRPSDRTLPVAKDFAHLMTPTRTEPKSPELPQTAPRPHGC